MNTVRIAAVVKDGGILAASILQGVGEDGHRSEVSGVVHLLRES
jgi:hypothetical protein